MNVRFYLKRPKSDTSTTIYSQIHYNMTSFRYYLPTKVNPNDWDFKSQRMKPVSNKNNVEFNNRLEWMSSKITDTFYNYLNNNDGKMPTEEIFRQLLDKMFEKRKGAHLPSKKAAGVLNFEASKVIIIVDSELVPRILDAIKNSSVQCIHY